MTVSIDGKVTGDFLSSPNCVNAIERYYQINRDFSADGFACGRITMEGSFTGGWYPDLSSFGGNTIDRTDYIALPNEKYFAVAFDRRGRLGWKSSHIIDDDPGYGGAHIIEVLCEDVSDSYLAYLRSIKVSYIFAGRNQMDLSLALNKLHRLFGINKLLLEGGSIINGAFQREDVIDELSLVMAPITAQPQDKPLFDGGELKSFELIEAVPGKDGSVWLRYKRSAEQ